MMVEYWKKRNNAIMILNFTITFSYSFLEHLIASPNTYIYIHKLSEIL